MADQETMMEALDYCLLTGFFRWKISPSQSVKAGEIAEKRVKEARTRLHGEFANHGGAS